MRRGGIRHFLVASLASFFVAVACLALASDRKSVAFYAGEQVRLRAHFDSVVTELRSRDVSWLSDAQRRARAVTVAQLLAYRNRDLFPHNHATNGASPVFRDAHGTLCAMAHLIASTGRQDIVEMVARSDNTAPMARLARDGGVAAWLDSVGLTVAEAERIQPTYGPPPKPTFLDRYAYFIPNVLFGIPAGLTAYANFTASDSVHHPRLAVGGLVAGARATGVGWLEYRLSDSGDRYSNRAHLAGAVNMAAGLTSVFSVIYKAGRVQRATPDSASRGGRDLSFHLAVWPTPSTAALIATGRLRF